jgi:hypothetical protein
MVAKKTAAEAAVCFDDREVLYVPALRRIPSAASPNPSNAIEVGSGTAN